MYEKAQSLITAASRVTVIQAENPDGDSLGSALALEEILGDFGKEVSLHCPVEVPKYLRYLNGWDRVTTELDASADLVVIVDTAADILLSKTLDMRGGRHFLESRPVLVIDHHTTESNLSFSHEILSAPCVSTGEVVYRLADHAKWTISPQAAEHLLAAQMSDSLGLTTQNVTPESFFVAGKLTELGASNSRIESARREFMKKSPEILEYKADLIKKVEYHLDGKLALVHIPFDEIEKYSDKYNPGALIGDELRLVENVELSCVVKTYPDGKATGRLRANLPIAEAVAGYFGGGGHDYAAGFRVYEAYDTIIQELVTATDKALKDYGHAHAV